MIRRFVQLLACAAMILARHCVAADPATVLILVNDRVPDSIYVGEYYATRRGIPFTNIVHLSVPLACCDNDPIQWDSWNIGWDTFDTYIRAPLKQFLEDNGLRDTIKYIVPTYGIPVRTI